MNKLVRVFNYLLICLIVISPLYAGDIYVIDGDSLIVNGVKTRMYGIDAPEYKQTCFDEESYEYPCGQISREALYKMITDKTICIIKGHDKYNRILTVCYNDNIDINSELVKQGMAVAYSRYSDDYIEQEEYAKQNKIGLWRGEFVQPEQYRIMNKK